jgi:type IX secretion system PorP/SprF family membrane protein
MNRSQKTIVMKNIMLYAAAVLALFSTADLKAQQDPQFTHYMYNTLSVNPAYAGSRGSLNVSALHRQQWIGFDGAPMTQTVYAHMPLPNEKMGVGLSVINDKIGPLNQTFIYGDYSYTVRLSNTIKLAFGIKAGLNMFQPKIAGLSTIDGGDAAFVNSSLTRSIKPNLGAGLYLHNERWYIGASSPRMLENKFNLNGSAANDTNTVKEARHLFLIGGLVFPINSQLKLKPTAQVKMVRNAPLSVDATVEALIRDQFNVGVGMRLGDSFYGLVGYQFSDQFKAGLSYDYTLGPLRNINGNTVEIFLSYDFFFRNDKIRSPRYF